MGKRNSGEWKDFDIDVIDDMIPDDDVGGDCVVLYDQCEYKGESVEICAKECDIRGFNTKSIYVPEGKTASLFGGSCGEGKAVKFTGSVDCIDKISFHDFLSHDKLVMTEIKKHN